MTIVDAERELDRRVAAVGLSSAALDPWEAWKVFKEFLAVPVDDDVYDAASFQCGHFDSPTDDQSEFCAFFVHQFSRREGVEDDDAPLRRVIIEFHYPSTAMTSFPAEEVWSHDFHSLSEFAAVVEGHNTFQAAVADRPTKTEIYSEEL